MIANNSVITQEQIVTDISSQITNNDTIKEVTPVKSNTINNRIRLTHPEPYTLTHDQIHLNRFDVLICHDEEKLNEAFKFLHYDLDFKPMFTKLRPKNIVALDKLSRPRSEYIQMIYVHSQTVVERHPLDITYEELIGIYMQGVVIIYNEEAFFKYETILRIMYDMVP